MTDKNNFATIGGTSTRTATPGATRKNVDYDASQEKVDFTNILLFKSGTFNNIKSDPEHLEGMVNFQNDHPLIYADLKLDHIDDKKTRDETYPVFKNFPFTLGRVKKLKTKDNNTELYGDYINVFEPVKAALDDKLFTTHSAEIYYNVTSKETKKKYPAVLGAVSILPAGKFPALMEVFKPYMYDLGDSENDESILSFNQDSFLKDFEYEKKIVCNLDFNFSKEFEKMPKEQYQQKMKKYMDENMKCKSYDDYMKMDEAGRKDYEAFMEDKYKEMMGDKRKKKFEAEGFGLVPGSDSDISTPPKAEVFSMEALTTAIKNAGVSTDKENAALKQISDLVTDSNKKAFARVSTLENQLLNITNNEKKLNVSNFVDTLIDSETPQLLPKHKEKAIYALMSCDSTQKVNYNLEGKDIEKTSFELLKELLSDLPKIQQKFSITSFVTNKDGNPVEKSEFSVCFSKEYFSQPVADQEAIHKDIVKQAQVSEFDISQSCESRIENYAMAMEAYTLVNEAAIV